MAAIVKVPGVVVTLGGNEYIMAPLTAGPLKQILPRRPDLKIIVTSATIGAEVHLPFGGTKGTGNGHREAGTQVLDIFSEWKSLYIDYSGKLQKAQIDAVEI